MEYLTVGDIIKVYLHVLMFVGDISHEVVGGRLKLTSECELLHYARTHVAEIFPRLEKPNDSHVTGICVEPLKPTVVPENQCYFSINRLRERKR